MASSSRPPRPRGRPPRASPRDGIPAAAPTTSATVSSAAAAAAPAQSSRSHRHSSPPPSSEHDITNTTTTTTNTNRNSDSDQDDDDDDDDTAFPLPHFYNTTFSAHRVSPLYLGKEDRLTSKRLRVLAQRLRDLLVGDVVRGVEVGLGQGQDDASGVMGRAGALEAVGIRWVRLGRVLDIDTGGGVGDGERPGSRDLGVVGSAGDEDDGDRLWRARFEELRSRKRRALHIVLRYENAECAALLLPALGREGEKDGEGAVDDRMRFFMGDDVARNNSTGEDSGQQQKRFLNMPLLLLRMPGPLKAVIADFLAVSFDCRVSPLRLGTRSMVRSWESWIQTVGLPSRGPLAKDVALSFGFYLPPAEKDNDSTVPGEEERGRSVEDEQLGLKSIDIIIPAAELRRFADAGGALSQHKRKVAAPTNLRWGWEKDARKQRKLAGRLYEEGWEWRQPVGDKDTSPLEEQPFTEALGRYIDQHLGLNLFHPSVRVTKIACGGFVMSEARLKVFAPVNLGEVGSVSASSPGQRGAVLELLGGLADKASVRVGDFI